MKIHLIKTPEYSSDDFNEVCSHFCHMEGPLQFEINPYEFSPKEFPFLNTQNIESPLIIDDYLIEQLFLDSEYPILTPEQLSVLCDHFRETNKIPKKDIVLLTTRYQNTLKQYNLAWEKRNGFIQVSNWGLLLGMEELTYYLAYEIIINVLRTLMNIDTEGKACSAKENWCSSLHFEELFGDKEKEESDNKQLETLEDCYNLDQVFFEPIVTGRNFQEEKNSEEGIIYIHLPAIGCFNDGYKESQEIPLLKLRTADICPQCLQRLASQGVNEQTIDQAIRIFEDIREQLLFKHGFTKNVHPKPLIVTKKLQIFIEGKEIKLTPLFKTLFLFYLKHPEGVRLVFLQDHKNELLDIYHSIRPSGDEENIRMLAHPYNGTFSYNKSKLNRSLRMQIGEPLAGFYCISGNPGEAFKIPLDEGFVYFEK